MTRRELYDFIRSQRYGVISSVNRNGAPQSALIGISPTPELEIIFDTLKTSRKYPNLLRDSQCSLVVGWIGEKTLQIEGEAEQVAGHKLRRMQEVYLEMWPEASKRMHRSEVAYLVMRPRWVRFSDYEVTPPLIWEGDLASSRSAV